MRNFGYTGTLYKITPCGRVFGTAWRNRIDISEIFIYTPVVQILSPIGSITAPSSSG